MGPAYALCSEFAVIHNLHVPSNTYLGLSRSVYAVTVCELHACCLEESIRYSYSISLLLFFLLILFIARPLHTQSSPWKARKTITVEPIANSHPRPSSLRCFGLLPAPLCPCQLTRRPEGKKKGKRGKEDQGQLLFSFALLLFLDYLRDVARARRERRDISAGGFAAINLSFLR